jgi:hypothetical protein
MNDLKLFMAKNYVMGQTHGAPVGQTWGKVHMHMAQVDTCMHSSDKTDRTYLLSRYCVLACK